MSHTVCLELNRFEALRLIRIIGLLQTHLESAIESVLIPGTNDTNDPQEKAGLARDRRDWKQAEEFVKRIGAAYERRAS